MKYAKRKALKIKYELLADGALLGGKAKTPFPIMQKKLDKAWSVFIRLSNANEDGVCFCITCGKAHHWKAIDCGHFVDRDHLPTRWHKVNCKPQCIECNRFKTGKRYQFGMALNKAYGVGTAEYLIELGDSKSNDIKDNLDDLYIKVLADVRELKKRLGIK